MAIHLQSRLTLWMMVLFILFTRRIRFAWYLWLMGCSSRYKLILIFVFYKCSACKSMRIVSKLILKNKLCLLWAICLRWSTSEDMGEYRSTTPSKAMLPSSEGLFIGQSSTVDLRGSTPTAATSIPVVEHFQSVNYKVGSMSSCIREVLWYFFFLL